MQISLLWVCRCVFSYTIYMYGLFYKNQFLKKELTARNISALIICSGYTKLKPPKEGLFCKLLTNNLVDCGLKRFELSPSFQRDRSHPPTST